MGLGRIPFIIIVAVLGGLVLIALAGLVVSVVLLITGNKEN